MSYISPIKLNTLQEMEEGWTDKVSKYIAGEVDNLILESCMKVSCDVNKDELLKALQYDRGQYEKGYADGKRDAQPHWVSVEEPPKEKGWYYLGYLSKWNGQEWWVPKFPDYWTEPPQEVQDGQA